MNDDTANHAVWPEAGLRARMLAEARRRRPPAVVAAGAPPCTVHRAELARTLLLLGDLGGDDWIRAVDPPELAGWTVHDTVVHLVANESLLAEKLGLTVPGITETADDNEGRTEQARARHAACQPALAVGELEAAAAAVDLEVSSWAEDRLDETIQWWGQPSTVRFALVLRTFETWTHADDIRRALGLAMVDPPAASLLTMVPSVVALAPRLLGARGRSHEGKIMRFRFPALAGAAWDVDLGGVGGIRPAGDGAVDAEFVTEAVDLCRVISARLDPGALDGEVTGDQQLADEVLDALRTLAAL